MNRSTHRNRKLIYLGGIIALLIPVVLLGMPADADGDGGYIAELRQQEGLGEASLGEVDPASSSMNLMLLGLRGIAANMLWLQADEQKEHKQFDELEQTVKAIIKLQPHYINVWKFQSWNLAYNVSAEFDAIADRYYWIKKGMTFLDGGLARNERAAELFHDRGDFVGKKLGMADEWRMFRRYFLIDPDVDRWKGGPDERVNPFSEDNYQVAKQFYEEANETETRTDAIPQKKMARALFRSYPARAQLDFAEAIQREGRFDQVDAIKAAWSLGRDIWANKYGREIFTHSIGGNVILNWTPEDIEQLAEAEEVPVEQKMYFTEQTRKMVNYDFWMKRSKLEADDNMINARRLLFSGKRKLLDDSNLEGAREDLIKGLTDLQTVIDEVEGGNMLLTEKEVMEDAIKSIIMWEYIQRLLSEEMPEDFPLKQVWTAPENQRAIDEQRENFRRRIGSET